jgi:hypothetical protein
MLACGGADCDNGRKGIENLKRVKEILSQNPSFLNKSLDEYDFTPLITASCSNCISVVEYLLSCEGVKVNKQTKVSRTSCSLTSFLFLR